MERMDLYGECNLEGAPVDVFTAECCVRCVNPGCTRSSFGQSKFEIRTGTWYERLFDNVPRMDRDNPDYEKISAQNFVSINPTLNVSSNWEDGAVPLDLPEAIETKQVSRTDLFPKSIPKTNKEDLKPAPKPDSVDVVPVEKPTVPDKSDLAHEPKTVRKSEPEIVRKPPPARQPVNPLTANTPVKQGQMIEGHAQQPTIDSWDAPIPTTDTDNVRVVKPGEKIKLR